MTDNPFPKGTRPEDTRAVDLDIDIDAELEDVWPFLSTSEGLSSWYVDIDLESQTVGASAKMTFGPGMVVPAEIHTFEVNDRIRLGAPTGVDSPRVEEYQVKKRQGGGCTVRIVSYGFGHGAEWDAEYEAVKKGWTAFLGILKTVVEQFRSFGAARRIQLLAMGSDAADAREKLLGLFDGHKLGNKVEVALDFAPSLSGTVDMRTEDWIGLVDRNSDGGMLFRAAVESHGPAAMISVIFLLFGATRDRASELEDAWGGWFSRTFPAPEQG